jgi:hypothetical protein
MGREIAKENDECGTMNEKQNSEVRIQESEYKAETTLTDSVLFIPAPYFWLRPYPSGF